ncbi:MAG: aminotransferase class V-fold PLP-dependent enzyme [bacterium]|nr:aminotransferase class V-fold PLP-dependent enzyme [bacterium]
MVYLDNAATSWPKPEEVYLAVDHFMREIGASPGRSGHSLSIEAGRILFETREAVANLFGITDSSRIIFTLNATEALNLGIKGILTPGDHVITTSMEHNSVSRPLRFLEKEIGIETTAIPCSKEGHLDPGKLESAIRPNTRLIVIVHASNVTGAIMPVAQIGRLANDHNIPFMVDAAQTAGVYPIDVEEMKIDLLAFTGHKGMLGPQGTGGLYIREGLILKPLLQGGTGSKSEEEDQPAFTPDRYESGTHNTPGLAGLGAGVRFILKEGIDKIREKEKRLLARLLSGLEGMEQVKIYGPKDPNRQTALVSINIEGIDSSTVGYILSENFKIMTRVGLHCAPSAHRTIGTFPGGTVRFSLGYFNTEDQIDYTINSIQGIDHRFGHSNRKWEIRKWEVS